MATPKILNTTGAAHILECSETWIHKLVETGRLRAHVYNEAGILIPRRADEKRQGQGLYFREADVEQYKQTRRGRGRPKGSKNKSPRKVKTRV